METVTILVRREFYDRFEARLRAIAPQAKFITFSSRDEMIAALPHSDGLYGGSPGPDVLANSGRLKWIHMRRAGVEHDNPAELDAHGITLTNCAGAFDVPMAEHAMALALALARGLPKHVRDQVAGEWDRDCPHVALTGKALGVYGVGHVGTELARKAHGFGMRACGVTRRARPTPDFMEALWTEERLDEMLAIADVVVMCAALTERTRGRFGAHEFGLMKPTSLFINVSRGQTVVQEALIDALTSGKIGGAGLDVMDPEPLPPDHVLRRLPNVILTPHISAMSETTEEDMDETAFENIRRFAAGEPLMNVVDPDAGY